MTSRLILGLVLVELQEPTPRMSKKKWMNGLRQQTGGGTTLFGPGASSTFNYHHLRAQRQLTASQIDRFSQHGAPISTMSPTIYFGYGSNLWLDQMKRRCPDNQYVGVGVLADW